MIRSRLIFCLLVLAGLVLGFALVACSRPDAPLVLFDSSFTAARPLLTQNILAGAAARSSKVLPLTSKEEDVFDFLKKSGFALDGKTKPRQVLITSPLWAQLLLSLGDKVNFQIVVPEWQGSVPPKISTALSDRGLSYNILAHLMAAYVELAKKKDSDAQAAIIFASSIDRPSLLLDVFQSNFHKLTKQNLSVLNLSVAQSSNSNLTEEAKRLWNSQPQMKHVVIAFVALGHNSEDAAQIIARPDLALGIDSSGPLVFPGALFSISPDEVALSKAVFELALELKKQPERLPSQKQVAAVLRLAAKSEGQGDLLRMLYQVNNSLQVGERAAE